MLDIKCEVTSPQHNSISYGKEYSAYILWLSTPCLLSGCVWFVLSKEYEVSNLCAIICFYLFIVIFLHFLEVNIFILLRNSVTDMSASCQERASLWSWSHMQIYFFICVLCQKLPGQGWTMKSLFNKRVSVDEQLIDGKLEISAFE